MILARGGMELSWRYAWALFVALLVVQLTFPLPAAVCAMVLGAVISRMAMAGKWRNYQKIMLQTIGFVLFSLLILYWIRYLDMSFWHFNWVRHLFLETKSLSQWLILFGLVFFLWLFWQAGRLLAKKSQSYIPICAQFDKGLGLFILLLVVYALVDVRTELNLQNPGIRFAILAFFTFSLASIALSRHHTRAQKSFIKGYNGIGVVLSALTLIGLFATGTTLLAYPYLFHKADSLLLILKDSAQPLKPLLIKILIFLFRPKHMRLEGDIPNENIPSVEDLGAPVVEGWQATLFNILGTGLLVLFALAILAVTGFFVYKLAQWLLKREQDAAGHGRLAVRIQHIVKACWAFLLQIRIKIRELMTGMESAEKVYYRLLRWGRHSGLTPIPSDTPNEYADRLRQSFPDLNDEILMIVAAFNREIYGHSVVNKETLTLLVSAHRRMRRLRYWPSRMRIWLRH